MQLAKAMLKRLNNPARFGFPVFVVLDAEGRVIHIQDSSFLEEGQDYNLLPSYRRFLPFRSRQFLYIIRLFSHILGISYSMKYRNYTQIIENFWWNQQFFVFLQQVLVSMFFKNLEYNIIIKE